MWRTKWRDDDLINLLAVAVNPNANAGNTMNEIRSSRWASKKPMRDAETSTTGHADDANPAVPERGRNGDNRLITRNDFMQPFAHL